MIFIPYTHLSPFQMLREKEKGDWKKLTAEEKKSLYRFSFCQTLAEVEAPTGEWKRIMGITIFICAASLWGYILLAKFSKCSLLYYLNTKALGGKRLSIKWPHRLSLQAVGTGAEKKMLYSAAKE